MRIAYIILAHKLPAQLIRLIKKLNAPSATFLVHIDKKADADVYEKVREAFTEARNVHFLERHSRYYGDYNHVRATLDGIQKMIELAVEYDYVLLLTGQDYPLRSNRQLQDFFRESQEKSFMEYFLLPSNRWGDENGGLDRINYWHLHWRGSEFAYLKRSRLLRLIPDSIWNLLSRIFHFQRTLPEGFKWYGGSAYWCLSRACIEYVDEFVRNNRDFVQFFEHAKIAEETFFQTVLLNSPLKDQIIDDNLRFIDWSDSRHPAILKEVDFERFFDSSKLFARKFDISKDEAVLNMIDQAVL